MGSKDLQSRIEFMRELPKESEHWDRDMQFHMSVHPDGTPILKYWHDTEYDIIKLFNFDDHGNVACSRFEAHLDNYNTIDLSKGPTQKKHLILIDSYKQKRDTDVLASAHTKVCSG